ncbi:Methyltransferase-Like Protein 24 [Manis pentadactyla]|nr:Methyltransferase-Like Protein 24 [Manis pentadactyla]
MRTGSLEVYNCNFPSLVLLGQFNSEREHDDWGPSELRGETFPDKANPVYAHTKANKSLTFPGWSQHLCNLYSGPRVTTASRNPKWIEDGSKNPPFPRELLAWGQVNSWLTTSQLLPTEETLAGNGGPEARCDDTQLEVSMAHNGHEVRHFDSSDESPTLWGAPFLSPRIRGLEGPPSSYCCPRKLGTILNELRHHKARSAPCTCFNAAPPLGCVIYINLHDSDWSGEFSVTGIKTGVVLENAFCSLDRIAFFQVKQVWEDIHIQRETKVLGVWLLQSLDDQQVPALSCFHQIKNEGLISTDYYT